MLVVDEGVVRVLRHDGLAEQDLAAGDAEHHDRVAQRGVQDVPLEVAHWRAGELLVLRAHVGGTHEMRHARHPVLLGQVLEEAVDEDHPGDVDLARAVAGHLPVEHGDGAMVSIHHVADPGIAPADHALALVV